MTRSSTLKKWRRFFHRLSAFSVKKRKISTQKCSPAMFATWNVRKVKEQRLVNLIAPKFAENAFVQTK